MRVHDPAGGPVVSGYRVFGTTGVSYSPFEHLSGGYVYGGSKRDGAPPPGLTNAERTGRRNARADRFGDVLARLGHAAPWRDIPLADILGAGAEVGVGERTARRYLTHLRRQQAGAS